METIRTDSAIRGKHMVVSSLRKSFILDFARSFLLKLSSEEGAVVSIEKVLALLNEFMLEILEQAIRITWKMLTCLGKPFFYFNSSPAITVGNGRNAILTSSQANSYNNLPKSAGA